MKDSQIERRFEEIEKRIKIIEEELIDSYLNTRQEVKKGNDEVQNVSRSRGES